MSSGGLPVASIVIPAHNEESVLGRCLDSLLADARPDEFEVVVVANGCTDATVAVARTYAAAGVVLVETSVPSKAAALNLGDRSATTFPRVFLDADVVVRTAAVRALVEVVGSPGNPLAASPTLELDCRRSSGAAKRYLRIWRSLPVFQQSYVGSGCYALSAQGRARFEEFPDQFGDDRFIDSLFLPAEKLTVPGTTVTVTAPTTLRGIVRRGVRVKSGSRELDGLALPQVRSPGGSLSSTRVHLVRAVRQHPADLSAIMVFVGTQVVTIVISRLRRWRGNGGVWLRDETSRF